MKYSKTIGLMALCALAVFNTTNLSAETAEEKGLAIATEAEKRDAGWGDSAAQMQMILRKKKGQERTREMRSRSFEMSDDGDKSIIIFDDPADVKGTAMLTHSHKVDSDDQWLFLPKLKRIKRISSSNKSGAFMSSEFAFEDLGSQEIEKYTYKYLKDETLDERETFVVERIPVDRKSGYTKQIVWIDQETYRVPKIDFYDRKNTLLKTLTSSDYNLYLDKHWRPNQMDMVNHVTGKSTTLKFSEYEFGNGLSEDDFTKTSLKRAK